MKINIGLILTVLFLATTGFAQAPTTSVRPEARPATMTADDLGTVRPRPRPEIESVAPTPSEPVTPEGPDVSLRAFLDDWETLDNPHLYEVIPDARLKEGAVRQPAENGLLRADDPTLVPGQFEQMAYQVSGVTFLGMVSAQEASRLTGAPIRGVYVDSYPRSNNRTYNTYGLLNHKRHLKDARFMSGWVSGHAGGLARSDVGGAQSLVRTAEASVRHAKGVLSDATYNMQGMGLVQAAAIAEAEAAIAAAEEALRLAQEALEKAQKEKEEDEAAEESDSDTDNND